MNIIRPCRDGDILSHTKTRPFFTYFILRAFTCLGLSYQINAPASALDEFTAVNIVSVHHLGPNYSIDEVYVNAQFAGNAGREGGGGGFVCCIMLPEKWRPGLVANVTWTVLDWRNENYEEIRRGDFNSVIVESRYIACAPVEYYDRPQPLYVHFFPRGRLRVAPSAYGAFGKGHPISDSPEDESMAAQGTLAGPDMKDCASR